MSRRNKDIERNRLAETKLVKMDSHGISAGTNRAMEETSATFAWKETAKSIPKRLEI
jgi:hypothetical protein